MNERDIIMQIMDDLATLHQTAKEIKSSLYHAIVLLKIHELQSVLETLLTTEIE